MTGTLVGVSPPSEEPVCAENASLLVIPEGEGHGGPDSALCSLASTATWPMTG